MVNLVGQDIDHYHIVAQLGQGGMATVYRAIDTRLEREVAVKVIRLEPMNDEAWSRMLQRFVREARALAKLSSANIVKIFDYGDYSGSPYLVMELINGGTLKASIGTPMPWQEAAHLLAPVARALQAAHEKNIIHRDIKPENILLTPEGVPMLSDFGIAKDYNDEENSRLTSTGMAIGTPEYMAPEQWLNKISPQTDVYSLGVVFYELITGRKPFTGDTPRTILRKQATEPLPPPRQIIPDLPDAVDQIVFTAMATEASNRYANMEAFASALEGLEHTTIEPHQQLDIINKWKREAGLFLTNLLAPGRGGLRNWKLIGSGLVLLLLVGAAIALINSGLQINQSVPELPVITESTATDSPLSAKAILPSPSPVIQTPPSTQTVNPTQALGTGTTRVSPGDNMLMVYVPEGPFLMGSTDTDINADNDEKPQHTVTLDAYWIDRTEVTNAMFGKFVAATGYHTGAEISGKGWVFTSPTESQNMRGADWQHPEGPASNIQNKSDFPVVLISWKDANAYCQWAGRRLPGEAEWEKAARSDDGRIYPWGNIAACDKGNFAQCISGASSVGLYPSGASPYGALDMAGNVAEWTADWYDATYYANSPVKNPPGPSSGTGYVVRGGAYVFPVEFSRSAYRDKDEPDLWYNTIGFRCATAGDSIAQQIVEPKSSTAIDPSLTLVAGSVRTSEKDGMHQVFVPAGNFLMGSDKGLDPLAFDNEIPQHQIYLDAFWIDRTDVTNSMYAGCVSAGACSPPLKTRSALRMDYYGNKMYANYPVIYVSWEDAVTYCAWAGRQLPGEAEWEKAARSIDGRIYPWGNSPPGKDLANYGRQIGDTTETGNYSAGKSPFGALDMAGNVWQWVGDWFSDTYYQDEPSHNPSGPTIGSQRGLRGGSWYGKTDVIRSANRNSSTPTDRINNIGFRCASSH